MEGAGPTVNSSNASINISEDRFYEDYGLFYVTTEIDMYALPIILAFGVPANIVAVLIFSTKSFRQSSCGLYLMVKCVSDTVFLLCTFVVWLETVHINVLHIQGVCQLVLYLTYISPFVSVWFVVALTAESLIRIRYPFKVSTFCTLQVSRVFICGTAGSAFLLYTPVLWLNRVGLSEGFLVCQRSPNMSQLSSIYTYLDTLITLILPSAAILFLLALSFQAVWISKARNKRMYKEVRMSTSVMMQQQVTRMLTAVSVSFIVMALPSHIVRVTLLVMVLTQESSDITPEQYMTQHVLMLLYYLTFSASIIIYIVFSRSFRHTFCLCLHLWPKKLRADHAEATTHNTCIHEQTLPLQKVGNSASNFLTTEGKTTETQLSNLNLHG